MSVEPCVALDVRKLEEDEIDLETLAEEGDHVEGTAKD